VGPDLSAQGNHCGFHLVSHHLIGIQHHTHTVD
jgi:hypothetical protein